MAQGNHPFVILNDGKRVYVKTESSEHIKYDQTNPGLNLYGPINILDGLASGECGAIAAKFIEKTEVLFGIKYTMNVNLMTSDMALKIKSYNPDETSSETEPSDLPPTEFLEAVATHVLEHSLDCVAFDPDFGAYASINADGHQESHGFNSTLGEEAFPVCHSCGNMAF